MPADRRPFAVLAAAGVIDVGAVVLLGATPHAWVWVLWGVLHVIVAVAVLRLPGADPTRRLLAAAMIFSLPLLGVVMAVLVVKLRGRGGDELLASHTPVARSASGAELARRLTAGGSACESLLAGDAETRHVVVAALRRDADARAIALLRWSLAQPDPDLAVEAALALEELSVRYAERSAQARAEVERRPSRDSALAAAEVIASAIHNGLADPALLPVIAAQARSYYRMAAELDEPWAGELAWARARLELAMLDPEAALALIEPALAATPDDERLLELYRDAAYAARRFELLAPVAQLPMAAPVIPEGHLPLALPVRERAGCHASEASEPPEPREEPEPRHGVTMNRHLSTAERLHESA